MSYVTSLVTLNFKERLNDITQQVQVVSAQAGIHESGNMTNFKLGCSLRLSLQASRK